jgi:hypothetical protein
VVPGVPPDPLLFRSIAEEEVNDEKIEALVGESVRLVVSLRRTSKRLILTSPILCSLGERDQAGGKKEQ